MYRKKEWHIQPQRKAQRKSVYSHSLCRLSFLHDFLLHIDSPKGIIITAIAGVKKGGKLIKKGMLASVYAPLYER